MDFPKTVLANGVFDLLHYGHLLYLEAASKMGDYLVVAVTRDKHVNKGPGRPVNTEKHRAALIQALYCVNEVILSDDALDALKRVKPDIFVKGKDYKGKIEKPHADYCKKHGIAIRLTDTPIMSATKIINDRLRQSKRF